jgi:Spy/CpxP family protein refolding chaperone
MKMKVLLAALALSASTGLLTAQDSPPSGDAPRPPGAEAGPHGPRGMFHILPPGAADRLNLSDDQKKQIADLEADVKTKMEKILTSDQLAQLKKMHPRPPRGGGGFGGGQGGGPDGGQGGPGGPGGGPDGGQGGPGGSGGGGNQPPN